MFWQLLLHYAVITILSLNGELNKGLFLTRGSHITQVGWGSAPPGDGVRKCPHLGSAGLQQREKEQ